VTAGRPGHRHAGPDLGRQPRRPR